MAAILKIENPWEEYNYVHESDRVAVNKFNDWLEKHNRNKIIVNVPPAPCKGRVATAKVIVLTLNPKYDEKEDEKLCYLKFGGLFIEQAKMNYSDIDSPLFYNKEYIKDSAYWYRCFKDLCNHVGEWIVTNMVATINFYPYHSKTFGGWKKEFETDTQKFGFDLVREAMKRDALIIMPKSGRKLWEDNVEDLKSYSKNIIKLTGTRSNYVSRGNCKKTDWNKLVSALKIYERTNGRYEQIRL